MSNTIETQIGTYLTFRLKEEKFAVNVSFVKEILEISKVTKVPHSPSYMKGIINLRGNVLPLIDLNIKLGLEATQVERKTRIIVFEIDIMGNMMEIGAMVDAVSEVAEINSEEVQDSPELDSSQHAEYITGMAKHKEAFIMLIDIDKVFTSEEVSDLDTATLSS